MLLRIIDNRNLLIAILFILYVFSHQVQFYIIFPIESSFGFEITQHASMVYIPAGFVLLSFYLLRWWFLPIVLIGRSIITTQVFNVEPLDALITSMFVTVCYPLWLHILNNAKWDVLGDNDQDNLTIAGVMIFQFLASFTNGIFSAIYLSRLNSVPLDQSFPYIVHFVVGDTLGAGIVAYGFYLYMKLAVKVQHKDSE